MYCSYYIGLPVTSTKPAAAETLLKLLSCKCKKGCTGGCSSLKAGLKCSPLCNSCRGKSCNNVSTVEIECDEEEDITQDSWVSSEMMLV